MDRRGPRVGDSKSLWNFTPSPGWSKEEVCILKLCLMKFGVGQWVKILNTGLLPGKVIQQLNGQTQRLLGQQSLAGFTGLRVDIDRIREFNESKKDVTRKCGLIIYSGAPPTKEMKQEWRMENQEKYGLTDVEIHEASQRVEELKQKKDEERMDVEDIKDFTVDPSLMEIDPGTLDREGQLDTLLRLRKHLVKLVSLSQKQTSNDIKLDSGKEEPKAIVDAKQTKKGSKKVCSKSKGKKPALVKQKAVKVTGPRKDARVLGDTQLQHQEAGAGNGLPPTVTQSPSPPRPLKSSLHQRSSSPLKSHSKKVSCKVNSVQATSSSPETVGKGPRSRKRRQVDPLGANRAAKRQGVGGAKTPKSKNEVDGGDVWNAAKVAFDADVASLVSMGYSKRLAKDALEESNLSLDSALDYLLRNCT